MNCEKGDLAYITGGGPSHGCIVKVLEPYHGAWRGGGEDAGWIVDRKLLKLDGSIEDVWADKWLRPLRDNHGTDETLLWAPVPSKLKEKA